MTANRHSPIDEEPPSDRATSARGQLRCKRATTAASESRSAARKMLAPICGAHSGRGSPTSGAFGRRRLLAGAILCLLAALLVGPQLQPNNFRSVEGLKALKALAKTFVYQQLTQRKNFVPLPVPIPVPIEINEPPVYLKGKPKYVNVYRPKPTAAPAAKPTTVYHMPIYSPTYEYMSMDPMSSMYGHVAPVVYPAPYGKASLAGAGYKSAGSDEPEPSGYANGAGSPAAMMNFNDYDDDSGHYYLGRSGGRHSKLVAATAGDYFSGASLYLNQRKDDSTRYEDAAAAAASQQHHDLATSSSANSNSLLAPPPATGGSANELEDSARDEEAHSESGPQTEDSPAAPTEDETYDHEQESPGGALRRSKRQVSYQSGYDGKENCEGLPIEVNVRSRLKLDRIFPIFGNSQLRKCVKPKKPFHILPPPPPEEHY